FPNTSGSRARLVAKRFPNPKKGQACFQPLSSRFPAARNKAVSVAGSASSEPGDFRAIPPPRGRRSGTTAVGIYAPGFLHNAVIVAAERALDTDHPLVRAMLRP